MTYQRITWAIEQAASEGVASAVDAFGLEDAPPATVVWEFLNEQVWIETGRPEDLPLACPQGFIDQYNKKLREAFALARLRDDFPFDLKANQGRL